MAKYKGLVYVKHGAVGSKSEGPIYYLQTKKQDYELEYMKREKWELDYQLEFYVRGLVETEGEVAGENRIKVQAIKEIGRGGLIPRK